MALGRQMNDAVDVILVHDAFHGLCVRNIGFLKAIIGQRVHICKILRVAGIRQFVDVYHQIIRILFHQSAHHMTSDEAGAACYHYMTFCIHCFSMFCMHFSSESRQ